MVKIFLSFLVLYSFSFADEVNDSIILDNSITVNEKVNIDPLNMKIQTFIDKNIYIQNKAYIDILFSPKSDYYHGEMVNTVKVIQTLKENGLLSLFFKKPTNLKINFKTSGSPIFFVKLMSNTLRNIGYFRYVTKESNLNNREFTWSINLVSEYATDPQVLQNELLKSGCTIVDIEKNSATDWTYIIDMRDGHLNVDTLVDGNEVKLKRSVYAHWLDVSNITRLEIQSSRRNNWYPKISYYNSSLNLLKVISKDTKMRKIALNIPRCATYIKISDIYTLKNLKDSLILTPTGSK